MRSQRLLRYSEIPPWQKDNEYLLSGYRATSGSLYLSLKSSMSWHNETINIHTHTLGSLLFALLPLHFYTILYTTSPSHQPIYLLVFTIYSLGVSLCFACSASYHILWNHTPQTSHQTTILDFTGIAILIWSASIASIHYAFTCHPVLQWLHWTSISLAALGSITLTLTPRFRQPTFRKHRALLYTSLAFLALIFILHSIYIHGYAAQSLRLGLKWMGLMALLNILGAVVYVLRWISERWYPYTFDFTGASHQLFHILVFAAGLVHYKALSCAFLEVRGSQHSCLSGV